jgi:hypothetical protein
MGGPSDKKTTGKGAPTGVEKTKCLVTECKTPDSRFEFCAEHFEQFKFGLITKVGKKVSDYDKKIDHYVAYKARLSGQKAA